jgi:hypothetical protein
MKQFQSMIICTFVGILRFQEWCRADVFNFQTELGFLAVFGLVTVVAPFQEMSFISKSSGHLSWKV